MNEAERIARETCEAFYIFMPKGKEFPKHAQDKITQALQKLIDRAEKAENMMDTKHHQMCVAKDCQKTLEEEISILKAELGELRSQYDELTRNNLAFVNIADARIKSIAKLKAENTKLKGGDYYEGLQEGISIGDKRNENLVKALKKTDRNVGGIILNVNGKQTTVREFAGYAEALKGVGE